MLESREGELERLGMVLLGMLRVFGELFERGDAMSVAGVDELGKRRNAEAELLLRNGDVPERAEHEFIRNVAGDGALEQNEAVVEAFGGEEPAAESDELGAGERDVVRGVEGTGHDGGEAGERDDVETVVLEDAFQRPGAACADVVEIELRDEFAGHVADARDAEYTLFELPEPAAFKLELPETARAVEEVEVLHACEGRTAARHAIARFQQRLIEGAAVVGDQDVEVFEVRGEGGEGGGFFGKVAEEELADDEAGGRNASNAGDEGDGAGAAGQACGFGVEEGDAFGRHVRDGAV